MSNNIKLERKKLYKEVWTEGFVNVELKMRNVEWMRQFRIVVKRNETTIDKECRMQN